MKCKNCKKDFTYAESKRKCGTGHYAEYGFCSEKCYNDNMKNMIPNPYGGSK